MAKSPKIIYIVGPTASGKSDLAVYLAKKLDGEIISADSRQVYKGLDVGSAKITKEEMAGVKHYLLDVASPRKNFSLGRYLKLADRAVGKILKNNKLPIFVGGTWLYFKAIKEGWVLPNVKPDTKLRTKLERQATNELFKILQKLDRKRAWSIDRINKRRLVRAIEIVLALKKIPEIKVAPKYQILAIAPNVPINELEDKIEKRLYQRLGQGLLKEILRLKKGLSWKRLINFGLEYDWLSRHLIGDISLEFAIQKCLTEIKRFAKKQIRTFRKEGVVLVDSKKEAEQIARKFLFY